MFDLSYYERQAAQLKAGGITDPEELRQALARLQQEASAALEREREMNANAMRHAASHAVQQKRQLLGDAVFADVIRRQIATATPAEILAEAQAARDPWLATLWLEYGRAELRARTQNGDSPVAAPEYRRLEELAPRDPMIAKLEAEEQALERAADAIRRLALEVS